MSKTFDTLKPYLDRLWHLQQQGIYSNGMTRLLPLMRLLSIPPRSSVFYLMIYEMSD